MIGFWLLVLFLTIGSVICYYYYIFKTNDKEDLVATIVLFTMAMFILCVSFVIPQKDENYNQKLIEERAEIVMLMDVCDTEETFGYIYQRIENFNIALHEAQKYHSSRSFLYHHFYDEALNPNDIESINYKELFN